MRVDSSTRGVARQAGWGLADQALSSLTNFALGVVIARTVTTEDFGAFSLAFATYLIALNIGRSLATQPLTVRFSASEVPQWRRATADAVGAALVLGLLSAAVLAALDVLLSGVLQQALLALCLVLPGLILQDAWRFAFFSRGGGRAAFLNDLAWTVLLVPAIVLVLALAPGSVFWAIIAWGGSALAAGLFGIAQARFAPRPRATMSWLREHRDLGPRFLAESMVERLSDSVSLYLVGAVAGLGVVGAIRAALLLLGPLNILFQGIELAFVPIGVRIASVSIDRLRRLAAAISFGSAGFAAAWGLFVFVLPASVGTWLLGASWDPAQPLIIPLTLALMGIGIRLGAFIALRALADARRLLRTRAVIAPLSGFGILIGSLGGATGASWGLALTNAIGGGIAWLSLRSSLRDHSGPATQPGDVGDGSSSVLPA
jgi:O-antigen/teichoic acid export membrane protein